MNQFKKKVIRIILEMMKILNQIKSKDLLLQVKNKKTSKILKTTSAQKKI